MKHDEDINSVLNRLISEREKLDIAINLLMALKNNPDQNSHVYSTRSVDGFQATVGLSLRPSHESHSARSLNEYHDRSSIPYKGMKLLEAIKKLLSDMPKPINALEMTKILKAGGYHFESETPQNTVASTLSRALSDGDKDIRKVDRGLWLHRRFTSEDLV